MRTIKDIFQEDQADRNNQDFWDRLEYYANRDKDRQKQVNQLLAEDKIVDGEDCYYSAMIFHHSPHISDLEKAKTLAQKSIDKNFKPVKWLYAAITDRILVSEGKPQKFGTQYYLEANRKILFDYDVTTTDEDRAEYNVPPLEEILSRQGKIR